MSLIKGYDKEFIRELLDIIYFHDGKCSNENFRNILLRHKIIKPSTKHISVYIMYSAIVNKWYFEARNGRNSIVLNLSISDDELQDIIKQLQ